MAPVSGWYVGTMAMGNARTSTLTLAYVGKLESSSDPPSAVIAEDPMVTFGDYALFLLDVDGGPCDAPPASAFSLVSSIPAAAFAASYPAYVYPPTVQGPYDAAGNPTAALPAYYIVGPITGKATDLSGYGNDGIVRFYNPAHLDYMGVEVPGAIFGNADTDFTVAHTFGGTFQGGTTIPFDGAALALADIIVGGAENRVRLRRPYTFPSSTPQGILYFTPVGSYPTSGVHRVVVTYGPGSVGISIDGVAQAVTGTYYPPGQPPQPGFPVGSVWTAPEVVAFYIKAGAADTIVTIPGGGGRYAPVAPPGGQIFLTLAGNTVTCDGNLIAAPVTASMTHA